MKSQLRLSMMLLMGLLFLPVVEAVGQATDAMPESKTIILDAGSFALFTVSESNQYLSYATTDGQ